MFSRMLFRRSRQNVAAAATSLQERRIGVVVELAAEAVYVDFDEVRERVEGLIPDVFGDFRAADNAAGIASEEFKERILLAGQGDGAIAALGGLRGGVERKVAHDDLGRAEFPGSAQQSAEPGEQLAKLEGLREVVVSARIESSDAVLDSITGGKHEHGHALAESANGAADVKTILAGNHDVQDDEVVIVDFNLIQGFRAGGGDIHGEGLLLQTAGNETHDTRIVFDEEQPHASIIRQLESGKGRMLAGRNMGETRGAVIFWPCRERQFRRNGGYFSTI